LQKPRVLTRPPFATEAAGLEAIELAESVGLVLDPWQQLFVRVVLAEDDDGLYAAQEVGQLVSRQNGKGGGLEAVVLHGMFVIEDPLTLWTAHQFKTSTEAFLRMRGWIDGSDDLRRRVKKINASHGEEGIELLPQFGGARLRFLARSKSSGRGFSPQRIIFDEAQELAKSAHDAMWPSMRAQRNKQGIFTGTVPDPVETNNPEHFTRMRDRGRAGTSKRLAWIEHTPEGSDNPKTAAKIDRSDPRVWLQANPGVGYREGLTIEGIGSDLEALDPESFDREVLSIWPSLAATDTIFGPGNWVECISQTERPSGIKAMALSVSLDRSVSCISAAAVDAEGVAHVNPLLHGKGTGWVVNDAVTWQGVHDAPLIVDEKGPAGFLIDALERAGVKVLKATLNDYLDACAQTYEAITEEPRKFAHYDNPILNDAVTAATWRKVGKRLAFDCGDDAAEITALESGALAMWAAQQTETPQPFFAGWR